MQRQLSTVLPLGSPTLSRRRPTESWIGEWPKESIWGGDGGCWRDREDEKADCTDGVRPSWSKNYTHEILSLIKCKHKVTKDPVTKDPVTQDPVSSYNPASPPVLLLRLLHPH